MRTAVVVLVLAAALAACKQAAPPPEDIRPVRTLVVQPRPVEHEMVYAGEVRPRYESTLGFRVNGKILTRLVNVGDAVKKDQVLAKLDPKDLALGEASSRANVAAQEASFAVEQADLQRYKDLLAQGFISRAEYDRQEWRFRSAQAQLEAVRASLRVSANQTAYAELRADHDGIVTAIEAENGQVVAAGQAVVRLAWSGETEVAASIPEDRVQNLRTGLPVEVSLWAEDGKRVPGVIRELASSADPATRTYSMRVAVAQAPKDMRLGMTANVHIPLQGAPQLIRIPLSAYIERDGKGGVWLYDPKTSTANFREIRFGGAADNDVLVAGGLAGGDTVITAGASYLRPGQKVKPLQAAPALANQVPAAQPASS